MTDLNALTLPDLYRELSSTGLVRRLLALAAEEDLDGPGDITTLACLPVDRPGRAEIVARGPGVIAGLAAVPDALDVLAPGVRLLDAREDGSRVRAGDRLGVLDGGRHGILRAERTILNLLGRLSGVATRTAQFVAAATAPDAGAGRTPANPPQPRAGPVLVCDTRKTIPGLRVLEKYAVRCGGGWCHRLGLHDAVLIKDNHLAGVPLDGFADFVAGAARRARAGAAAARRSLRFIEVEADGIDQFERILEVARREGGLIDLVLLDNFAVVDIERCVAMRDSRAPRLVLEASGGVTLESIARIARTGVDRVSVGSLTHGAAWLDVALDALP